MDDLAYLIASRMKGLEENLQVIAHNLANASTPGFKRTVGKFSAVMDAVQGEPPNADELTYAELSERALDFSAGAIRRTGRPLDVAVHGPAMLVVQTPDGERYTRKGRLYLTPQGELVDGDGHRFAAAGGTLRLPPDAANVSIDRAGNVKADGATLGRLRLVDIPRPDLLVPEGGGRYRNDGPAAQPAAGSQLVQGAVEESNVKPVHEMVALIEVMRAYEAASRIARRLETLNQQLVQDAS